MERLIKNGFNDVTGAIRFLMNAVMPDIFASCQNNSCFSLLCFPYGKGKGNILDGV
jgi:hypothetical protein